MEFKNLLGKLNQGGEAAKQFLALEISAETVKTAVWQVVDEKTSIVRTGSIEEWQDDSAEELVTAADASLTKALEGIPKEPEEVIFGLPESWVGKEGIAEGRKSYLQTIVKKLGLKPVGFVVTTEALAHYLRTIEGGPPSAILLALSETEVAVTVVRLGTIVGTQTVGRSEDLSKDVEEGLSRFGSLDNNLPSRMLLYDGTVDLEAAKQVLLSYDWQERLPFLHFPKIDALEREGTIRAVAIAGGTEVARALGFSVQAPEIEKESVVSPVGAEEEEGVVTSEGEVEETAADFGFEEVPVRTVAESKEDKEVLSVMKEEEEEIIEESEEGEAVAEEVTPKSKKEWLGKIKYLWVVPGRFIRRLKVLRLKIPRVGRFPPVFGFGLGLLVLLVVGTGVAYWYVPKATVTIYVSARTLEKEVSFMIDPAVSVVDAEQGIIPGEAVAVEVAGDKEIETTGKKVIGERSKGTVTIFNRTQSSKTFSKGTALVKDSLRFSLDSEVTVASASTQENSDLSTTITPATVEAAVTAADIGEEANLSEGTQLTVASFASSSFVARVKTAFSGGYAETVRAVAKEDRQEVYAALIEELKLQVADKVGTETSNQEGVVEVANEEVKEEEYSAEVGEEAERLKLQLSLELPVYTYRFSDLTLAVERLEGEAIPENYRVERDELTADVLEARVGEDKKVEVRAKVVLKLVPEISQTEVVEAIRGKYSTLTEEYFKSLPNFSRQETKFNVYLPSRLKTFPRRRENISVEVRLTETDN